MKPGYQTTEFWLSLACAGLSGALGVLQLVPAPWAVTSVTILGALYTVLRSALKVKATPAA